MHTLQADIEYFIERTLDSWLYLVYYCLVPSIMKILSQRIAKIYSTSAFNYLP